MFTYDAAITDRYPDLRGGVIHATGLVSGESSPALLDAYRAEQRAALARLATTPIAEIPSIAAWRRVFTSFGARPTQHRNAAESLLRRLDKQGDIPSINTLVDLGNLVAIRYALPVAVLDLDRIDGTTTVRFATGDEPFTDLGADEPTYPEPGEVVFVDRSNVASARRWCWRQSAQSATGPTTTAALITVEGHHETASQDVRAALADLVALLAAYQPAATGEAFELSADDPRAEPGRGADLAGARG
jgi:DNA/RNA-binding domain of Phe-tRNA-synthetase-like protein